jgi:hypothetical protein
MNDGYSLSQRYTATMIAPKRRRRRRRRRKKKDLK